ncbi:MAG: DUF1565 domain-containing protein [candidate division Zixibacteria bacterium]|nr:DUF1565 domain-containing protein [candidate division Zixibacteria bacterium]
MRKLSAFAIIMAILFIFSCGDDNPVDPSGGIKVMLSPDSAIVNHSDSIQFTAGVYNTTNTAVKWYVYDIENGDLDSIGSIDSTGWYKAPDTTITLSTGLADSVIIWVVSQEDTSKKASSKITIVDPNNIYVDDGENASDETGTGTIAQPYRTITKGLSIAETGQTVRVFPGTYSDGETFPITPLFGRSVKGVYPESTATVRAPAGENISNAAFLIQNDLISIESIGIVGTGGSGVGINFAGSSDTTQMELYNCKIDSCYIGAIQSTNIFILEFKANEVSNCDYGLIVDYENQALEDNSLFINDTTIFTDCITAIDIKSEIEKFYFENSIINTAATGISLKDGEDTFLYLRNSQVINIDSIGIMIDSVAYANLGDSISSPGYSYGNNTFSLVDEDGYFIYNSCEIVIRAGGNTWYASDSAYIDTHIYDNEESGNSSGEVVFHPYTLEP